MNPGSESDKPIEVLKEQESPTSPQFMNRVRGKIYRRTATSQLASYSWHLPKVVLVEMVGVLGHLFSALTSKKESKP